MKWSVRILTVKGITLYLHVTFLFLVAWLVVLNVMTDFSGSHLFWSVLFLMALLVSILLHEYGHAIVAARFGINANTITLYPIGGIASIEKLPSNPGQELLISAAGPLVNLVLAAFCWLFSNHYNFSVSYAAFNGVIDPSNFLSLLGVANLFLAAFNLIPAFPLDGGRLLRALFAFRFNYIKATSIVAVISKSVAAILILYGLGTMQGLIALLGIFILVFAQAEEAYLQLNSLVAGHTLSDMLMFDYNSIEADLTVQEVIAVLQNNHSQYFILMEKGMPVGTLNRIDVIKALANQQYAVPVASLMKEDLVLLEGDRSVSSVLRLLADNDKKLYPVMQNGRFIGVINFQHVIEYLLLNSTHSKEFIKTKSLVELV